MMKKIILGLVVMASLSTGCSQNNIINLEGRVSLKGSSVHTYLVIKDKKSKKSYKIENEKHFSLMKKQNQIVKIRAKLIKKAIGPGFPAVVQVLEVQ